MTTFCRICSKVFAETDLVEGACVSCRELKAKPHATHAAFKAEDLPFEGRRSFPWGWVALVLVGSVAGVFLWPSEGEGIPMGGAREITADEIVEAMADTQDEDFVRALIRDQEIALYEVVAKLCTAQRQFKEGGSPYRDLQELHQLHLVTAHWLEGGDRPYTLTLELKGDDYELRASPKPPYTRHYLVGAEGRVRMAEGKPATAEDAVVKRLSLQKKKS